MNRSCARFAAAAPAAILLAALAAAAPARGQSVELTPYAGYRFGGDFEVRGSFADFDFETGLEIDDGSSYGLILDIGLTANVQLELLWGRQESQLLADPGFLDPTEPILDLDLDHYHGGVLFQWGRGQVKPFLDFTLGATRFSPTSGLFDDETRFSVGLGGGVKVLLSEHLGVRFDGRYISTLIHEDDELFCDPFGFCFEESVSEYMEQGEVRGGLIILF